MSLRSRILTHTEGNRMFWFMVSAIVLVSIFYVYSVNRTVIFVAERNAIETKISANQKAVTALETQYIEGKGGITKELASSLGYGEAPRVIYTSKKAVSVLERAETIQ